MRTPDSPLPLLVAALALAAGPAMAADEKAEPASFSLHVESAEGDEVRIEASSGWLGALIASADVECEGDADGQARAMMEDLRRQGEGGYHRYRDEDDGDLVIGRRSRGALKLETRGDDGDRAIVEMPWEVAECLMLGIDPPGDLGRRIARGEAKLSIDVREGDGGDRVNLRLE